MHQKDIAQENAILVGFISYPIIYVNQEKTLQKGFVGIVRNI